MPQVRYRVDLLEGVWTVGLGEKRFGPYSSLDTAIAAASKAAHKAEAQGYEAFVVVNAPEPAADPEPASEDAERDAARIRDCRATGSLVAGDGLEPSTCGL